MLASSSGSLADCSTATGGGRPRTRTSSGLCTELRNWVHDWDDLDPTSLTRRGITEMCRKIVTGEGVGTAFVGINL
eukprot:6709504-Pyramimonas_sp.AAC.1